jgi:hypothetical protein
MLFIDNKYTSWYYQIVTNAKARNTSGYTETHHILPKSLGGTNDSDNLVALTAREHFVCHLLLTKMVTGVSLAKMSKAAWMMSNCRRQQQTSGYQVTSRQYATLREQYITIKTAEMTNNNPMSGRKHTVDAKQKVAAARTGKKHTEETKAKIREKLKNRIITEETRRKLSVAKTGVKGREHTAATKAKMSAAAQGRKPTIKHCVHCGESVAAGPYARFHGNNCKNK